MLAFQETFQTDQLSTDLFAFLGWNKVLNSSYTRNYSATVLKKVQTNSEQKANANPIVDAVG